MPQGPTPPWRGLTAQRNRAQYGLYLSYPLEIECCARCGGELKIIASIEEPQLIAKILSHLERAAPGQYQSELALGARGPPGQSSLL